MSNPINGAGSRQTSLPKLGFARLGGGNKEGTRGRHVRACAAWLCLVCHASRPRRTLRSSAAVNVSIQTSFEPSLSSFCDFPTSPYLPVLPSDPGRWRSHLCCVATIPMTDFIAPSSIDQTLANSVTEKGRIMQRKSARKYH